MICEMRQEIAGLRTAALDGDFTADDQFRRAYGEMLERLVRRVLRRRRAFSDFERSILRNAEAVEREGDCDRHQLAEAVAARILNALLSSNSVSRRDLMETIVGI